MWEGCDFFAWWRLLSHNHFAVHPRFWYIAIIITFVSAWHTILRHLQDFLYSDELARTPIRQTPLFIIGHWRTGTTLLHELLILDGRHTYPNSYQCLDPNHFLLTEAFFRRWVRFLMPSRRPMDNMAAGWERPQEDEFALCMLGQPSPYLTVAFPNQPPQFQEYFDIDQLAPRAREKWKHTFLGFLRRLTIKDSRRLILKSPPHSCRIATLLEIFPEARFIHIVRDPYVVFPSTMNLWKSLYQTHGMQCPTFVGLEEYVFSTFSRLYESLEEGRKRLAPGRFYELRYEDLVHEPLLEMHKLYEHLGLGGFDDVRPRIKRYLETQAGYQTNRYELDEELESEITRRWGRVIEKYGYRTPTRSTNEE
jgi:hypothetical protein